MHCDLGVAHAGLVNLLLGLLSNGLLLRDLIGQFLGGGQHFDGSLILQNVAFRGGQHLQDLVLNFLQLPAVQKLS